MKKISAVLAAGAMIFMLSSCGQGTDAGEVQTDTGNNIVQGRKEAEGTHFEGMDSEETNSEETDSEGTHSDGKEDTVDDVLENLVGEYDYTSEIGNAKLTIQKASYGYDICDYESEVLYRFLAGSSDIEKIENNKIYLKYPERVVSDDMVDFSYYILEYDTDGIDVYCAEAAYEEAQFLYHATKQGGKDTEHDSGEQSVSTAGFIDYEALGIKKYEYPAEFSMGDNLKTAIAQLALSYADFDRDTPKTGGWKETFIAEYIQNSRVSFDYLELISDQNDGQISIDELNYIQYSLTNTELDFSSLVNGSVNRYEAASPLGYAVISGYDYEDTDNGVVITADLEAGYDGAESVQKYKITAELARDPYSCFDGYSIVSFSSTMADNLQGDTKPFVEEVETC